MPDFFATCPRGLEALLAEDIQTAGATTTTPVPGGVHFAGPWKTCYSLNLYSRIATRVLWLLTKGNYRKEDDIYQLARSLPWNDLFTAENNIRVDVVAIRSPLKSLEFITLRIKDAICDQFRAKTNQRPSVDTRDPDVRIHGFLTDKECSLYIDTSGAPLYQRGIRQKTVEAPLKENLAAGILRLTGWQPGTPLLDPMCGSGTFLSEAAQIALNIAPGSSGRSFGFQKLKNFQFDLWKKLLDQALDEEISSSSGQIYGSDISPPAVRAALANLDRAGLLDAVNLSSGNILELEAPTSEGIMIANPPYGERLADQDELAELYPALASHLKAAFHGWRCFFFTADTRLPKLMRLSPSKKTPLYNGALECRLYEFKMVSGSNRPKKTV